LPPGAEWDAATRELRWTPAEGQRGFYGDLRLIAEDDAGRTTTRLPIRVTVGDVPPQLTAPETVTAEEGRKVSIRLGGSAGMGATLRFLALESSLPTGAQLNPRTGVLDWTPGYDQAGDYDIVLGLSDGTTIVRREMTVTVASAEAPPVFTGLDGWQTAEGQSITVPVFAYDPDNPLYRAPDRQADGTLSQIKVPATVEVSVVSGLPDGAEFDADAMELRWTPGHLQAGEHEIVFEALDTGGPTPIAVRDTLTLVVTEANVAPDLTPPSRATVAGDSSQTIDISAPDPEGAAVTLYLFDAFTGRPVPGFVALDDAGDGTGQIKLNPAPEDRGIYQFRLIAEDNSGGYSDTAFGVEVTADNLAPQIRPIFDAVATVGEALSLLLPISDPDGETPDLTLSGLPPEAVLTPAGPGQYALDWTPGAGDVGDYEVDILASDAAGAEARGRFRLTVRPANDAPVIGPVGDRQVDAGSQISFDVPAQDLDGDVLHFTAAGLPDGAQFDRQSGTFRWTPDRSQAGPNGVTFAVSDGQYSAEETVTLTVAAPNSAPTFVPVLPQVVREGREFRALVRAVDPERDPLRIEMLDAPAGVSFDPDTGEVSWLTGYENEGDYTLRFRATDTSGLSTTLDMPVTVTPVNRAPTLAPPNGTFAVGEARRLALNGADPDRDALSYTLIEGPDGMRIDPATAEIVWTPAPGQAGDHLAVFTVTDGEDTVQASSVYRVAALPVTPDVRVEVTPGFPAQPGLPVLIRPVVSGLDPVATSQVTVNGTVLERDALGRFVWTPETPGRFIATIRVVDEADRETTLEHELKVRDPADKTAPEVRLDALPRGGLVTESLDLTGRIADSNLDIWRIELIDRATGAVRQLAEGTGRGFRE